MDIIKTKRQKKDKIFYLTGQRKKNKQTCIRKKFNLQILCMYTYVEREVQSCSLVRI